MRPSACRPCTRARAPAAGSCQEPRRPPAGRARAAADPRPRGSPPGRRRSQGRQAHSLCPAYAARVAGRPGRQLPLKQLTQNDYVIDEAELRQMTPDERHKLARALAAIDLPHPLLDPRVRRRRRFGLLFMVACGIRLAAWVALLPMTPPGHFTASH